MNITFDESIPEERRDNLKWLIRRCFEVGIPVKTYKGKDFSVRITIDANEDLHVSTLEPDDNA